MKTFLKWLEDNRSIYRIDQDRVGDFSSNLRTYYRSPDWTTSGTFDKDSEIPPDWQKEKGLFAGSFKHIVPYSTPRDVKWVITFENPKRPTLLFNQLDKSRIASYRPYLSKFSQDQFNPVPSGEFFSTAPGQAIHQELIRNPLRFMRQWYNVRFVADVTQLANELRAKNIHFEGEGV